MSKFDHQDDHYSRKTEQQPEAGLALWDVCAGNHGGNAESRAANIAAAPTKEDNRNAIYELCKLRGGITCREVADRWGVGMNQISGRFTELKAAGLIYKDGVRDGCGAMKAVRMDLSIQSNNGSMHD